MLHYEFDKKIFLSHPYKLELYKAENFSFVIICSNLTNIWHLLVKKDINLYEILIDSDRERNSASIERIFVYSKLNFDELLRQKPVFRAFRKCFKCLLLSNQLLEKTDICNQHAQLY